MYHKKILFLGGAFSQLPAIQYAKEEGCYVIIADYLPENPGRHFADEYYKISTTKKDEVLKLAKKLKIDAVSAYASDPAAPTAAYVSEKLNLVGSSCRSVEILSNKNLFRDFLKSNGFNCPWFFTGTELHELKDRYNGARAVLKPVDSSGSKGVVEINSIKELESNFERVKSLSRSGNVILEEFIERNGPQMHGEGFVVRGEIKFMLLGDQEFSKTNGLAPYSTLIPSKFHTDVMNDAVAQVKSVIQKVGFYTGGINIELIRDKNDRIYILEIGARNGGNFMPQLIKYATGFDLVKANIDILFNKNLKTEQSKIIDNHFAQIILHSKVDGTFQGVVIPEKLKKNILETNIYYEPGDKINKYKNSRDVVGVCILQISNYLEMMYYYKYLERNEWVKT